MSRPQIASSSVAYLREEGEKRGRTKRGMRGERR
jgi:hypothetical protein